MPGPVGKSKISVQTQISKHTNNKLQSWKARTLFLILSVILNVESAIMLLYYKGIQIGLIYDQNIF
jgi:rRNA processing protein Krr1/Pno1